MKIIDNTSQLFGDDLKATVGRGARLKIAASCFSMYAFEALKSELSKIESLQFIFTAPTFVPMEVTDRLRKERREFFIPKARRESGLYGTEFEIQLRNKLTQRAVARECADWIRKKARFRSNTTKAPMQQFLHVASDDGGIAYMPIGGFTAVDLGYQKGDAVSNFVTRFDDPNHTQMYLQLFNQIWSDPEKLDDVTAAICDHIESVYQENSPERIYFLMLYNIFQDFLEDIDEDVLPNDLTGYRDSVVWNKLFNYQKDAATGIINKLETYNGCILADSVGLGKTFTALAIIKYYELRNRAVLVLSPKKLADNWRNYNTNLTTNIFAKDRFNYDVLCHTDLSRTSGESFGIPLNRVNWGNYDLVVIDESHNFRNNDVFKDRETRYQKLMNKVIRAGVKTKVLMLSATPVNTRKTVAEIFTGVAASVFGQFRENPEHFISEASRIIAEQKATMIIERLAYDGLSDRYDVDIFTANRTGQDFSKASSKLKNHVYDYVVTDSDIERRFADQLDASSEVVVYAKLPRGFLIPTPVGDYNPDWAISFKEGSVKHIYFVAETKGTMSSMKLREIENTKIECARKFFDEIGRRVTEDRVKYDVVTSYEKLMDIVGRAAL